MAVFETFDFTKNFSDGKILRFSHCAKLTSKVDAGDVDGVAALASLSSLVEVNGLLVLLPFPLLRST